MGRKQDSFETKYESIHDENKKCEIDSKTKHKWKEIIKRQQNDISILKARNCRSDEELNSMKAKNERLQHTIEENNANFVTYEKEINALNNKLNECHKNNKMLEQRRKEEFESFKKSSEERRRSKNGQFLKQLKEEFENVKAREIKKIRQIK